MFSNSVVPDWVPIYYLKLKEEEMKCNICEIILHVAEKSPDLLEHIKANHKEVYELHKENPEATVGFRIEFLHLNVLSDEGDPKTQPIIIGEVCETETEEIVKPITVKDIDTLSHNVKKVRREVETRKKSWVWKYFDRISDIIYRCTLCDSILSIKGCNTNNMNRHVRTKHPSVYQTEMLEKKNLEMDSSVEIEHSSMSEDISTDFERYEIETKAQKQLHRRSWIWLYFDRISSTLAQCKLCKRNISHGGNATGNMNRHLKMIHRKTGHSEKNYDSDDPQADKDYMLMENSSDSDSYDTRRIPKKRIYNIKKIFNDGNEKTSKKENNIYEISLQNTQSNELRFEKKQECNPSNRNDSAETEKGVQSSLQARQTKTRPTAKSSTKKQP
ncbi:unnamed protein product [Diatraea saccharalis]|uniref:BED-type domain-containing protein n=1 Tax=Diatraea saccharalis TaxID=40085 RepID=A0A9N9R171_9NEOP|nr:unnamed protein product [Diatraea saccharalis]